MLLPQLSKLLFGNQDRLLVALAVARSKTGVFYAHELAEALGIVDPRVVMQLATFEKAGLIQRLPKTQGDRRVFFRRTDGPFWALCEQLAVETIEVASADSDAHVQTAG